MLCGRDYFKISVCENLFNPVAGEKKNVILKIPTYIWRKKPQRRSLSTFLPLLLEYLGFPGPLGGDLMAVPEYCDQPLSPRALKLLTLFRLVLIHLWSHTWRNQFLTTRGFLSPQNTHTQDIKSHYSKSCPISVKSARPASSKQTNGHTDNTALTPLLL